VDDVSETDPAAAKLPRRLLIAAGAVTALVAIAAVAISGFLAVDHHDARAGQDRRLAYIQAARQGVMNILTVHFDTAQPDVQRILDDATGDWRKEFEPQSLPFIDAVRKARVVTTADIAGAGLEQVNSDGTAQVLITANSKVSNSAGATDEPRVFRVRATVAPDDGRLKIAKMEYLPS
jgi:Mce-associated membrane protein